ncbi:MAG: hypothetical protein P1V20_09695 [Verrucomicrobiales bacterium]|nr:hypothetical protein [Verrucomicrobiales bacterium]
MFSSAHGLPFLLILFSGIVLCEVRSQDAKPPSGGAINNEQLDQIGDHLSVRMEMLKKRENELSAREQTIQEQERLLTKREEQLYRLEESLLSRDELLRKREELPPPQAWRGESPPSIHGRYAAVLDGESMQFYYTKNALEKTPVASTQKLMTALVVCKTGGLDKYVTITRAATQVEPTVIGIKEGERYTRRQLLTGLLVRSGNDIAAALAIDNAGSVEAFVEKMNLMGKQIGLVNSNFRTPHGLPAPGQYSCARDIAIVAFEAYQVPDIREMVNTKTYKFQFNGDRGVYVLGNTNKNLRSWEACNGMKTGYTNAAGRCLVSSANIDGKHRISVIIKSTTSEVFPDSRRLLEWSFGLEMLGPMEGSELVGNTIESREDR